MNSVIFLLIDLHQPQLHFAEKGRSWLDRRLPLSISPSVQYIIKDSLLLHSVAVNKGFSLVTMQLLILENQLKADDHCLSEPQLYHLASQGHDHPWVNGCFLPSTYEV